MDFVEDVYTEEDADIERCSNPTVPRPNLLHTLQLAPFTLPPTSEHFLPDAHLLFSPIFILSSVTLKELAGMSLDDVTKALILVLLGSN